ncbi:MAG: LD-carboxypeptidase [Blastocatellia bacterium]|nr:LD-carboxypeptidase [Blastocatellia bacterium]
MQSLVKKPPALMIGDTIAVVAPASNIKREMLAAGIRELQQLGYKVKYKESIFELARYTAGDTKRRSDELNEMLLDPEVKAIFAARGGYGSAKLFDQISPEAIAAGPKILLGYSDITSLLIWFYQKHSWVTFHGPMVAKDFAAGASHYDKRSFTKTLTRPLPAGPLDHKTLEVLHPGRARGRLLGGCLPIIVSSIGTDWELETENAILFLEDTATKPYQIDRMLTHLKMAGKLDSVSGIVFGEMNNCMQHPDQGYSLQEVVKDLTEELGVPVLYGLRSGHSEIGNQTLPFGVEVSLDCEKGILAIEEEAVQ